MSNELATVPGMPMTSPQQVRDRNAAIVLDQIWDAPIDTGLTATDLIASTGLTRATVLAICDMLVAKGLVTEDRAPRAVVGRGRQARRFTLDRSRRMVVGGEIRMGSVRSVVADLKGAVRGESHLTFGEDEQWDVDYTEAFIETQRHALESARVTRDDIEAACLAVAAPVSRDGVPDFLDDYWRATRPDLARIRAWAPCWELELENDANLAALAELRTVRESELTSAVTLLLGEHLGAGIVVDGQLLRGARGGAGELGYLERVEGVGNANGPGTNVRHMVSKALATGRDSVLHRAGPAEGPTLRDVVSAAESGDALAREIAEAVARSMAITISTLAFVVAPAVVVIAGRDAQPFHPLLQRVRDELVDLVPFPPDLVTSRVGEDVVLVGAVLSAIAKVRSGALMV